MGEMSFPNEVKRNKRTKNLWPQIIGIIIGTIVSFIIGFILGS